MTSARGSTAAKVSPAKRRRRQPWRVYLAAATTVWVAVATGSQAKATLAGFAVYLLLVWPSLGDRFAGRRWWSHRELVNAMTVAGILPAHKDGDPPVTLHYRGRPQRTDRADLVTVRLPAGIPRSKVVERREHLASALDVPGPRLAVLPPKADDGAGWVRLCLTRGEKELAPRVAAVATADRISWARPALLGRDGDGRDVTLRTRGTHSVFVGKTRSGKTWAARALVAHAVLDSDARLFVLAGKDDPQDWRPLHSLTERYLGEDASPGDVEQLLAQVAEVVRAQAGQPRPVVLVIEEWYAVLSRVRLADRPAADRLTRALGALLSTGSSRGLHVVMTAQRGTDSYIDRDLLANVGQRVVGVTAKADEVRYALGLTPAVLPRASGEFLVTDDDSDPVLVHVDRLDDAAFAELCGRATRSRPRAEPAPSEPAGRTPELTPEPPADPLLEAVLSVLADSHPDGASASDILARLPAGARPATPATLGRLLARWPERVVLVRTYDRGRLWRAL